MEESDRHHILRIKQKKKKIMKSFKGWEGKVAE